MPCAALNSVTKQKSCSRLDRFKAGYFNATDVKQMRTLDDQERELKGQMALVAQQQLLYQRMSDDITQACGQIAH